MWETVVTWMLQLRERWNNGEAAGGNSHPGQVWKAGASVINTEPWGTHCPGHYSPGPVRWHPAWIGILPDTIETCPLIPFHQWESQQLTMVFTCLYTPSRLQTCFLAEVSGFLVLYLSFCYFLLYTSNSNTSSELRVFPWKGPLVGGGREGAGLSFAPCPGLWGVGTAVYYTGNCISLLYREGSSSPVIWLLELAPAALQLPRASSDQGLLPQGRCYF